VPGLVLFLHGAITLIAHVPFVTSRLLRSLPLLLGGLLLVDQADVPLEDIRPHALLAPLAYNQAVLT